MKHLILLTICTLKILISCGQTNTNRILIKEVLTFEYLEGCETGKGDCKPIEIFRQNKNDSILLVFPSGGTESDVYLYSMKEINFKLQDKKVKGQGLPKINLTTLEDGEYTASVISCGLGGSCIIRLKTKPN